MISTEFHAGVFWLFTALLTLCQQGIAEPIQLNWNDLRIVGGSGKTVPQEGGLTLTRDADATSPYVAVLPKAPAAGDRA